MPNKFIPMITVSGNSMQPWYGDGDLVILSPHASFQSGDVIVFWEPNHRFFVMHRVWGFHETALMTKGDANKSEDPWYVTRDMILGKVLFRIPGIGKIIRILQGMWR